MLGLKAGSRPAWLLCGIRGSGLWSLSHLPSLKPKVSTVFMASTSATTTVHSTTASCLLRGCHFSSWPHLSHSSPAPYLSTTDSGVFVFYLEIFLMENLIRLPIYKSSIQDNAHQRAMPISMQCPSVCSSPRLFSSPCLFGSSQGASGLWF